jgi:uncharacterized phage protein gp47/JayE
MANNKLSYKNIVDNINAEITALLPDLDPTIFGSIIRAFVIAMAGRSYDHIQLFNQLEKNLFPQTADGDFLENRWAAYEGLVRNPATKSKGLLNIPADPGTLIPALTEFVSLAGNTYTLDQQETAINNVLSVSSLNRVGSVITVTTSSEHNFGTGITVTIAGADQSDYNGSFVIIALSEYVFSYEVDSSQSTTGTGSITASFAGVISTITSNEVESDEVSVNLDNSSQLTITTSILGVEDISYVSFLGIKGGIKKETDESLLKRVSQSRSNPVANFNVARIEKTVLSIPGNTRVLVKRITPAVGYVTIYFVRDDDVSILPGGSQIAETKDAILEYLQATSDSDNVIVSAPTLQAIDFNFTALSPNTLTMKEAIIENLKAFFRDEITFEQDVSENLYKSIIASTVDLETGEKVTAFTLSAPVGDVPVGVGNLAVLGTVTFAV